MIHLIIYSIIISSCSTVNGMDQSRKKSPIYIKTTDNQITALDKAIIQQFNLLTVLKDIYKGTEQQPLMAPVTKEELDSFAIAVRQPARAFAAKLNNEEYVSLMDIAAKLKAQLFLADLMERILPDTDAINLLALNCLDKASLKKAVYKKYLKKKSTVPYTDNMATRIISLKFYYDGSYFAETITTGHDTYTTNLRQTQNFFPFRIIQQAKSVTFSPDDTFIILHHYKGNCCLHTLDSTIDLKTNFFPNIHPNSNAIIMGNQLHTIDNKYNITTTHLSDNDESKAVFHPSLPLIISAEKNKNKTKITVHDVEKSTEKLVGTYQIDPRSILTRIAINSDGSLLLIDNALLLNIQDPYNPIVLKQNPLQDTYSSRACFITQKQITFFQAGTHRFFLLNKDDKEILLGCELVRDIIADPTDNYIALLFNNPKNSSTIEIFKTSNLEQNAQPITIKERSPIVDIAFVNDQLLLTKSYTTKLWDMEGDEVLDFGKIDHYAIHPQTNSIIASRDFTCDIPTSFLSTSPIQGPSKLYHYTINTPKAQQKIKDITESLTLSQALLLNNYFSAKTKKEKQLYPNLPDGRVFNSLPKKQTFLVPNLKLRKDRYLPIKTIQQEEK